MGIKVSKSENNYIITVKPEFKKVLDEILNHNNDISSHSALIAEIALKANQSTTYTKSEIEGLLQSLPTLDLSGQIGTHNTNSSAHEDIRATLLSEIVRATTAEASKVDKVTGKGLSTNDFTNTLMALLNNQSGVNTGDETQATIKTKLGVTTLSGSNTGDETQSSIISKLGGTGISSIGTCSTASYGLILTGTITATHTSATVTGSGTAFTTELAVGDIIVIAGTPYKVSAIASNTSLTTNRTVSISSSPYTGIAYKANKAKDVTLNGFTLVTGATIQVKFTNKNYADVPTLNVNNTGAKAIYNEAGTAVSETNPAYFPAGSTVEFIYDGTNWIFKKRIIENYVSGNSWYIIYSDGWIEQGGVTTANTSAVSATFLVPFVFPAKSAHTTGIAPGNYHAWLNGWPTNTTITILANVQMNCFWSAKGY